MVWITWILAVRLAGAGPPEATPVPPLPAPLTRSVDFQREIRPLLDRSCASCHGAGKQKGGLRLDQRQAAFRGGPELGPAIVPGQGADSPLVRVVAGLVPDLLMPEKGERLTLAEIALLRTWIDQGASWTQDAPVAKPPHWAFEPVRRPEPPAQTGSGWVRNPIDAFVLARLEATKLRPSAEADRTTLIRRLSFDLIGLPPTPAEVRDFEGDREPGAYPRLVDRLLTSPRHGERWARHWLDVVRFSETHGFEMNQPRPNAWPYRDYVIQAFNDDKPYNQFVAEQIAGDVLGVDEATGFLVAGPWDQVKSPDVVLTSNQRADELHDVVGTVGSAFLGLTLGCARCHEHKFDPVPQRDYYAIKAVFEGVQHGERAWRPPDAESRARAAAEARQRLASLEAGLVAFERMASVEPTPTVQRPAVQARENRERFAPVTARRLRFTILATTSAEPCLDELEVYTAGPAPRNVALATNGTRATASGTFPNHELHKLEHLNDARFGNSRSWISHESGRGWVELEFPQEYTIDRVVWGRDREQKFRDRLATEYRIEVSSETGGWRLVASSTDRVPYRLDQSVDPLDAFAAESPAERERLAQMLRQRETLAARIRELAKERTAYLGEFRSPEPTRRFHRGDPMLPREVVPAGALSQVATHVAFNLGEPTETARRRALAVWVVDPTNPLTARVMVNRLWQHHFGEGLVSTPSDFGANGARPTHPELLDWLASEFVAHGWSLKHIHRLIVTSATYRQSSAMDPARHEADAGARLLWRYPPRRLEAEAIRDAILAVCGNLDLRAGGPGFSLFEPNDNYVRIYVPRQTFGPPEWRRMIYATQVRQRLDGVFGAFDCPDGGQVAPRRTRSTTPLQALNLLNSGFMTQQAALLAKRLESEAGTATPAQIQRAFVLAFNRVPERDELEASLAFVREEGLPAFCRVVLNANEFVYLR